MAAHEGKNTVDDGLLIEGAFIRQIGIDHASISVIDGEGSSDNRVSPEAVVALLTVMAAGPDAEVYREAMPVLGVDGSLATAAAPDNPATGHIYARTGTPIQGDMNGDAMILTKGLAGYMTTKRGKDLHLPFMRIISGSRISMNSQKLTPKWHQYRVFFQGSVIIRDPWSP